jgi:hypothetical protein
MNKVAEPSLFNKARAKGRGERATSLPLILNSHAMDGGAVIKTVSAPAFLSVAAIAFLFSSEDLPANFRSCERAGVCGAGG